MPVPEPGTLPVPGSGNFQAIYLSMLSAEDTIAKKVELIYSQANAELLQFMQAAESSSLVLTASEQAYYGALQTEARRLSIVAQQEAGKLIDGAITSAFVEGALTHADDLAFNLIHDQAVRELSSYSLDLISQTTDSMRRAVQQQIGVALVEGLTAAELRERIVKTGLSNISRWRSIEQRAGVIARTETMRAYNHGALAGIRSTGASFVRWIASPDEATCSICQPRAGKVYRLPGFPIGGVNDPYGPGVGYLPVGDPPAHPRCRCTVRAVYRGPDGKVIGGGAVPTTPKVPQGGLVANTPVPAKPPSVAASFDDELARLGQIGPGTPGYAESQMFWRNAVLDEDQMRRLAVTTKEFSAFDQYAEWRFSIRSILDSDQIAAWEASTELRLQIIRSLERFRIQTGDRVYGSRFMRTLKFGDSGSRMDWGVLADCSSFGEIRLPPKRMLPYIDARVRVYDDGVDEILTHELGHALHNTWRYSDLAEQQAWRTARRGSAPFREAGSTQVDDYLAGQIGERDAWAKLVNDWDAIPERTISRGGIYSYTQKMVEWIDARGVTHIVGTSNLFSAQQSLKITTATVKKIEKQLTSGHMVPTQYAGKSEWEDFAESSMMYLLDPARLKATSKKRYDYMTKWFKGTE